MGVITGNILVDGYPRRKAFHRQTGYVQQEDLHLQTSTVREALRFSAALRQPSKVPTAQKNLYVEEVIRLLNMEAYADAVIGVPGEGLSDGFSCKLNISVGQLTRRYRPKRRAKETSDYRRRDSCET